MNKLVLVGSSMRDSANFHCKLSIKKGLDIPSNPFPYNLKYYNNLIIRYSNML